MSQNKHFNHPGCDTTFGVIGNSRRGNSAAALFAQVAGSAQSEPDGALELRLTPSTSGATASKATMLTPAADRNLVNSERRAIA